MFCSLPWSLQGQIVVNKSSNIIKYSPEDGDHSVEKNKLLSYCEQIYGNISQFCLTLVYRMTKTNQYSETCVFKTTPWVHKKWPYMRGGLLSEVNIHKCRSTLLQKGLIWQVVSHHSGLKIQVSLHRACQTRFDHFRDLFRDELSINQVIL